MAITNYGPYGVSINYRVDPHKGNELEGQLAQAFGQLKGGAYKSFHLITYRNWAGPVDYYHAFIPFAKFADLDNWPAASDKASNAAAAQSESHLQGHGAASVLGSDSLFLELIDSLSKVPKGGPTPYALALTYHLQPGAADDFEGVAAKASSSNDVAGVLTYRAFAGTTDAYHVVVPFNKFADLDGWSSTSSFDVGGAVSRVQVSFAEYVPSLSNPV